MSDELIIAAREHQPVISALSASALRATLGACARAFHEESGAGFRFVFGTSGAVATRATHEAFDLVAAAHDALDALQKDGRVGAVVALGASRLALGVRAGATAPDIATMDAFAAALLAARSIARGDPAGGGTAGRHLAKVFEAMGVSEALAEKSILRAGGYAVMREVVEGRADFGLTQSSELAAVDGAAFGAWLPEAAQMDTIYAIAPGADGSSARTGAAAFLRFMQSAQARALCAAQGLAPLR